MPFGPRPVDSAEETDRAPRRWRVWLWAFVGLLWFVTLGALADAASPRFCFTIPIGAAIEGEVDPDTGWDEVESAADECEEAQRSKQRAVVVIGSLTVALTALATLVQVRHAMSRRRTGTATPRERPPYADGDGEPAG